MMMSSLITTEGKNILNLSDFLNELSVKQLWYPNLFDSVQFKSDEAIQREDLIKCVCSQGLLEKTQRKFITFNELLDKSRDANATFITSYNSWWQM